MSGISMAIKIKKKVNVTFFFIYYNVIFHLITIDSAYAFCLFINIKIVFDAGIIRLR